MSEIVILGSGAGFATTERFSTSIAVCHNGQISLFDCGEPCAALMFRAGLDPLAIRNIFISHMHPDHVGGLAPVLFSMYLPGRAPTDKKFRPWSVSPESPWYREAITYPREPVQRDGDKYSSLKLHLPTEAIDPIASYLPAVYLAPEVLPFDLNLVGLEAGVVHDDSGDLKVRALANTHLSANPAYNELPALYPHMALESYSFSFDLDGTTVVYSGDITALTELQPLLGDADVVIVEVAHFDPEDLEPILGESTADQIVLTHIHPGLEERTLEAVRRWGNSRVDIASDGFRIPISH